ncbi:helix-turn-helix domain-containing protein [Vagococcus carniphilus]|uniref:helix-turn-helix domain-containing protein n=1 Tax=Vagococcus carniphilus TaxID=218144 RepID=UPI00288EDE51|nr:helix-turn-helix domain-containing protein [Vagococcus carniphilus]MDT2848885.1 helix-turn-helix domain-containing protein [Vagococcus carniphilus]
METIGEKLKAARIERGLTIGDLQRITKIQRRYLEAIEDNDFDAMPSDYYKRTFIRQFAEAVGLNPKPLLRRLDGKPERNDLMNTMALSIPVKGSRKSKYNETNTKKNLVKSYIPVALLVLVVMGIIGTIGYAIFIDSEQGPIVPIPDKTTNLAGSDTLESEKNSESKEEDSSTAKSTDEKKEKKKKKKEKKPTTFNLESDTGDFVSFTTKELEKPIKIAFKGLDGPAWVGLQSPETQELFYQYTIQPGEDLETFVPEEMTGVDIVVGAAPNVKIDVNGEELKFNEKTPTTGKKMITLRIDESNDDSTTNTNEQKEVYE